VTVLSSLSQALCAQAGDAVDRLKACAQFEGMERLKCVDELLGEMVEKPDSTQPQGTNWIISETTSPVDYRPQIAALTTARASSQDAPSSLTIQCRAQRTELIISTKGSWKPATGGEVKVVYRNNEEPSVEQRWRSAETGRSLAFPGDVVRFLRLIPDGGQFLVRVYAGKSPPYETTFQLAGLDPVRRKIAAACNWPGGGAVVAATTAVVEHVTAATPVPAPERKANNKDRSNHAETVLRGDAEKTAPASPNNTDHLVALLMARPEIKSVSDLTSKTIAIDDKHSASVRNVRTAIVAAGASEVELIGIRTKAINVLISGAVPAAVLALVSPEAADAFPDIAGFKILRIPLSPRPERQPQ